MELFVKIVNSFQLLTIFSEKSIFVVWLGSEQVSLSNFFKWNTENYFLLKNLIHQWNKVFKNGLNKFVEDSL